MVTKAAIEITSPNSAMLRMSGKKLLVRFEKPKNASLKVIDASAPRNSFDSKNPGAKLLVLDMDIPRNTKEQITVVMLPQK
jgi:hypothetical protein